MKINFTLEDLPDGGMFMASDPAMDALLEAARCRPETLTPAEAMSVVMWDALLHAARRMAKDRNAAVKTGTFGQPAAGMH